MFGNVFSFIYIQVFSILTTKYKVPIPYFIIFQEEIENFFKFILKKL